MDELTKCPKCFGPLDNPAASEDGDVPAWCPECLDFTEEVLDSHADEG